MKEKQMRGSTVIRTAALWLVVACASGGAMGGSAGIRDPNVITAAELAKENSSNVYDAIQHLRPEMLRQRPSNESSSLSASASYAVRVYLDTSPLGG
ncbi:MAG TPA: hypothetical protein VFT41_01500, partial [Gemmatimonadaceae bacterium]|nr:hypothetical protein [Gemmatimonadaceae bacterium]